MELSVALLPEQIAAANRLHASMAQWQTINRALDALAERFPGFEAEPTLLKVVAVNALYGTNVYAVVRMAAHAQQVIGKTDVKNAGPEFVERLAKLPPTGPGERKFRHYSFASKFAHFFVDQDRFPILDAHAEAMLRFHLRPSDTRKDPDHRYEAFVHNFREFRRLARFQGTTRELDRYLWLAGIYRKWLRNPNAEINVEAARLFSGETGQMAENLSALVSRN